MVGDGTVARGTLTRNYIDITAEVRIIGTQNDIKAVGIWDGRSDIKLGLDFGSSYGVYQVLEMHTLGKILYINLLAVSG